MPGPRFSTIDSSLRPGLVLLLLPGSPSGLACTRSYFSGGLVMKFLVAAALALEVGCTSSPGPAGANGPPGEPGPAGRSVTSRVVDAGNASCSQGGIAFDSASGTTYACNGALGPRGPGLTWKDAAGESWALST